MDPSDDSPKDPNKATASAKPAGRDLTAKILEELDGYIAALRAGRTPRGETPAGGPPGVLIKKKS